MLEELLRQIDDPSDLPWNEETYDLANARGLTGDDRATYIARLIVNARQGDTRAILTLAHLGANEALPVLQADAASQQPWAPTARRALAAMGHGGEVVDQLANDALHAQAKMARVAAVIALSKLSQVEAIDALLKALLDPEYEVRLLAWDGLVEALGLLKKIQSPEGKRELTTDLERMRILLGSERIAAFVRMGADGVRDLVTKLRAGASPESLGIQYAPRPSPELFQKLRLALIDDSEPFPVDELAKLSGFARRQAETIIALRLEENDVRAPEALVQLGAEWTAPAMDEVANNMSLPETYRQLCTQCARALRAS